MCSSRLDSKKMFPNYCFRRPPSDYGYEVMYVPKKNPISCHASRTAKRTVNPPEHRSPSRSRSRSTKQRSKPCNKDFVPMQYPQEPQVQFPVRTVEFRLPVRQSAGMESNKRTYCQMHQEPPSSESTQPTESPSCEFENATRNEDEIYSNFFNTIYENVFAAVHGAIERMVGNHFEDIHSKVERISLDLTQQQALAQQLNCNVINKIKELNESGIDQFKFIAQMIVDNRMIFFRSLNGHRSQKAEVGKDIENEQEQNNRPSMEATKDADGQKQKNNLLQFRPQHQLWQQQSFQDFSLSSTNTKCSHSKSIQSRQLDAQKPNVRLHYSAKGATTASMPDLHRGSWMSAGRCKCKGHSTNQSSTAPTAWTVPNTHAIVGGSNRKCRCPPTSEGSHANTLRRKVLASSGK